MKKVLLTTSALTLLAGAAAAQVSVGGDARMGISSTGGTTTVDYRYRIKFNASGETDGGLTFGAASGIRIDDTDVTAFTSPVTAGSSLIWAPRVWVGTGAFTLNVGNAAGAIESTSGIWGSPTVGYTGMGFGGVLFMTNQSSTSNGMGTNAVALTFALGNANVALSTGIAGARNTEAAVSFSLGNANVGIGYDTGAGATGGTYLTAGFDAGGAKIAVAYVSPNTGTASWSLGATMEVGAGSIKGYVANKAGTSNFGIGYSQGLGGGASASVGVESIGGTVTTEAGLGFKF